MWRKNYDISLAAFNLRITKHLELVRLCKQEKGKTICRYFWMKVK